MQLEAQLRLCQSCLVCYKSGLRLLSWSAAQRKGGNYYDLLGVKSDATLEEIKNAFFDKSKKLHPDSDPSNPALHSQFVELNEAYRVLSKELSRKEYDVKMRRFYSRGERGPASSSAFRHTSYGTRTCRNTIFLIPGIRQQHTALLNVLTVNSNRLKPSRPDCIHNFKQACHQNAHSPLFTFYHSDTTVQDNARYWEQMYQSHTQEMSAEERERRRRRNFHLVGYCFLTMALGIGAHFVFFRKLEEVHNNFMDEKDRVITEIYNESKERARVNGFKKQTEILRQKHAEFLEKYKTRNGGEK